MTQFSHRKSAAAIVPVHRERARPHMQPSVPGVRWLATPDGGYVRIDWSRVVVVTGSTAEDARTAKLCSVDDQKLHVYLATNDPEQAAEIITAVDRASWVELDGVSPHHRSFANMDKVGHVRFDAAIVLATEPGGLEIGRVSGGHRRRVEEYLVGEGIVPAPPLPEVLHGAEAPAEPADRLTRALLAARRGGSNAGAAFEELREAVCVHVHALRLGGISAGDAMRELRGIARRTLLPQTDTVAPDYFTEWIVSELGTWCLDEYYRKA